MGKTEAINGAVDVVNTIGIKSSHYIIAASGLVAALSWNTAIKEGIKSVYDLESDEVKANFIYAIVITCFMVILIWLLPDTKSELPSSTRRKIEQVQLETQQQELVGEIGKNKKEMEMLRHKIDVFEKEHDPTTPPYTNESSGYSF